MHRVLADDIIIDMVIIYYGLTCTVVAVHRHAYPEIGFSLLEKGRTKPKTFTMTARHTEPIQVSLKHLFKKL